ncbi:Methyltransferase type 11 [Yersinia frederiksenii ATCC 33641]|uniref:UbiE/COQ5 methyltransferase family protein n=1 Tax=Yersinia frederiksenii ATCC 33641 TaxID=349966 RepID=A0ABR4W6K8_YERFR|nr:class I SAM-dependent methyltransferase [Yersinia frederiksenii]EEQ13694.1 Methyltransferase type 11 [Yersinia frederiksenii ATCC 33641]KGA48260.1 ubiE/COQ5 methyltransferase family protein [Yersinia frederiksenii ATCC 33641]
MVAYRDFYLPLAEIYPNSNTCDLGCGRGEWLELLNEAGFKTEGIDLDEGMLSYCRDLNLNVRQQDVIQYLQSLDDNSVSLVSSFHLVEHIGFENVKLLVQEALRILKPGGLLIIETPNCENIIVSTNTFYLDPTHIMPIPNKLLSFLTNYFGFKRSKVIRLQGRTDITTPESLQLIDIFTVVGQDYGLVAQKDGPKDILDKFDNIYNKEFGSDLDMAINKFSMHLNHAFKMRDDKINELSLRLINEKNALELKLMESHEQIKAIYSSASWKITAPLRLLKKAVIFILPSTLIQQSKKIIKSGIQKVIYFISQRPNLRRKIVFITKKVRLYPKLKSIYYRLNMKSSSTIKRTSQQGSELLSPRANEIYTQLIKRKNNKDSIDI